MRFIISILLLCNFQFVFGQSFKNYPDGIYWVNSEYKLSPETFKDKYVIVMFWEMNDPIAIAQMHILQAIANRYQQLQLISIVQGDEEHKITLSELTDFTQEHNLYHPFGVAANLEPFISNKESTNLKIYVYDRSEEPKFVIDNPNGFPDFLKTLDALVNDREALKMYGAWQMRSTIMPRDYADPLLELPSSIAVDESSNSLFVAENSCHRIAQYNSDGKLENFIGGIDRGDKDDNLRGLRFGYISGIAYDPTTSQLFVADLDFQKIKAIDVKSNIGYTFLGNGEINTNITASITKPLDTPLSYPCDIIARSGSLFVLMAYPAQVLEVDIKTGKLIGNAVLETKLGGNERPIKLSKGTKGILVLTNKGQIYELSYEGDRLNPRLTYTPADWQSLVSSVEEKKDTYYLLMPRKNQLVSYKNGKHKVIAGNTEAGYLNSKEGDKVRFNSPQDVVISGNRAVISDRRNNMIRLTALEKGTTFSLVPKYSFDFFATGDALNTGEPVFFESEVLAEGKNNIHLVWDISDYEIFEEGYNALVSDLSPGVSWEENPISSEGVKFIIDTSKADEFVQVELYLTLKSKLNPDLIITKKAAINLNFAVIPGESNSIELNYYPHLLH